MKLMLDSEMFNRNYKSFKDINGRRPYIICSNETFKMLPQIDVSDVKGLYITNVDVSLSYSADYKQNDVKKETAYIMWFGVKVFIDDTLSTGEVIFA